MASGFMLHRMDRIGSSLPSLCHNTSSGPAISYYESSWSILSQIGLIYGLVGLMVMGIAGVSSVTVVPMVVSVASGVANGLSYAAYYTTMSRAQTIVAVLFAEVAWLVQEGGLSFYSYAILVRCLQERARTVFMALFWFYMVAIASLRCAILATRIRYLLDESAPAELLATVSHLHMGYFVGIALAECTSAFFLLRKFYKTRSTSFRAALKTNLFSYLIRSTEVRLTLLASIGVMRAITYSFQDKTAQAAVNATGQLDRFAYTTECLFPIVMYIDILASRLIYASSSYTSVIQSQSHPEATGAGGPSFPSERPGRQPSQTAAAMTTPTTTATTTRTTDEEHGSSSTTTSPSFQEHQAKTRPARASVSQPTPSARRSDVESGHHVYHQ